MDKVRHGSGAAVFFLCVFICFSITIGVGDGEEQSKKPSFWEWQKLKSAYSIYSSLFPTTTSIITGQHWHNVKALVNQACVHFFPPNLDFRRGDEAETEAVADGGAGERIKEALAKSVDKSKATLEDIAESAANIAGETVQKAKEKVKRSLSEERESERQNL